MKRLLLIAIAVFSLSTPTQASAGRPGPKWIGTPTCTATATTLSCSGKVARLNPRLSAYAELAAQVFWKCADADLYTNAFTGLGQIVDIRNGQRFTINWTPPTVPPEQPDGCPSGQWIRWDPNTQQEGVVYDVVSLLVFQPPASQFLTYDFGEVYPT
ncbi:MAG TPA: hypothetical protein VFU33_01585 [Gaiellaceae bacterium]|nr:hypothetical protein [Gaiellaceae bacterium]